MTPQEINIAIAEFEGHTNIREVNTVNDDGAYPVLVSDQTTGTIRTPTSHYDSHNIPNYYEDLNAIHRACSKLNQKLKLDFMEHLSWILDSEIVHNSISSTIFTFVQSPASRRCEALLKTIGKWKD